jgi:DNA-binding Lrp family transcriptional regulator
MAKKKIDIIASPEAYSNLQTFDSIDQLNETVRSHKEEHKEALNKTDLALLDLLHRYSAKHTGVSYLTKNNIAKMLDCSRKTVIRKCQKFEDLGIIKQYETKRQSDKRQTSNAIAILPVQRENVPQDTEKVSHQENNFSLKQIHNNNHLNIASISKRKPYIKMVPKRLQHFQAFFGSEIKDLYGRVWLSAKKLEINVDKDIM